MPRKPKFPTVYVAISPAMAAEAIGKPVAFIKGEVLAGRLNSYQSGLAHRIIVEDLAPYIRDYWKRAKPRRRPQPEVPPTLETTGAPQ